MTRVLDRITRHDATTFTCYGAVKVAYWWDENVTESQRNRFRIIREATGWQVDRSAVIAWTAAIRSNPETGEPTFDIHSNRAVATVFSSYAKAFLALRELLSKVHLTNKVAWF